MQTTYMDEQCLKNHQLMVLNGEMINLSLIKNLQNVNDKGSVEGYILEVDVKYLKHLHNLHNDKYNELKAFIQYSHDMQGVYKQIEKFSNPGKKVLIKVLILFDYMIADLPNGN